VGGRISRREEVVLDCLTGNGGERILFSSFLGPMSDCERFRSLGREGLTRAWVLNVEADGVELVGLRVEGVRRSSSWAFTSAPVKPVCWSRLSVAATSLASPR